MNKSDYYKATQESLRRRGKYIAKNKKLLPQLLIDILKRSSHIIQFILGTGVLSFVAWYIGYILTTQNQQKQIMTEYIREMSNLIIDGKIYRDKVYWDDINENILPGILDNKEILNKLLSISNSNGEILLDQLPQLDKQSEIYKMAEEEHREKRLIARALTLNTLRRLGNNGTLKGQIIKFLYESRLIGYCPPETSNQEVDEECLQTIIGIRDAILVNAMIDEAIDELKGINLEGAILNGASLIQTDLSEANFQSAHLNKAKLNKANLDQTNFSDSCLENVDFRNAFIGREINFKYATLTSADFRDVEMNGEIDFRQASLIDADFRDVKMNGEIDFRQANLIGADFRDVEMNGEINFKGAYYDKSSKFPPDFDEQSKGMIDVTKISNQSRSLKLCEG